MSQTAIPYYFFRGGSSRGPFFNRADLPADRDTLSSVLVSAIGSGHALNIDGIGGGNAVTTKVAILSKSIDAWADIDYFFAQVGVENGLVDYKPTCGNMMIAVGPAAIEMGLVDAAENHTELKIRAVNTNARVIANVSTPNKRVNYAGNTSIDGVPGTAAPVNLTFSNVAGSSCGALLPTGKAVNSVLGVDVSCIDFAMPMVIARASEFGISGHESRIELDNNKALFEKIESVRLAAAKLMGMGDCSDSVTPKFGLISEPKQGGSLTVRYFMPWTTHPTLAVTGSQCLSACALLRGTVADGMVTLPSQSPCELILEHPLGKMTVVIEFEWADQIIPHSANIVRTARKLAQGSVFVPSSVWDGT